MAAREGGGDPETNPRLRSAIAAAKTVNMPSSNVDRAIQKGTGQLPGQSFEHFTYEGYGPGGVAVYLEVMSDNRNRIVGEVRHIFTKYGGSLGQDGSVAWMFDKKGLIQVDTEKADEDSLMELAIDAGAEDFRAESGVYEILTEPQILDDVRQAIEDKGIDMASAEVTMLPQNTVRIEKESEASSLLRLMDALEDNDDVQKVYANFDIDESILEKLVAQ
jgi:YebC/PmpR family DNA-binding regulatory protein